MVAIAVDGYGPGIDAARYARSRPRVHAAAIETFRRISAVTTRLPCGLDAGCGTGPSAIALAELAEHVTGVDASPDLLAQAPTDRRVTYVRALAERMPFADNTFDVITAALSFHWFDAESFLAEASRVLRPTGWLAVYAGEATGGMLEERDFARWFRGAFLGPGSAPGPRPGRNSGVPGEGHGLRVHADQTFVTDVVMTADQFVDYALSTPHVIGAAERRGVTLDDAAVWLRDSVRQWFVQRTHGTFRFVGTVSCLRLTSHRSARTSTSIPHSTHRRCRKGAGNS
jgi:SAM-dependent methyltransferase